MTGWLFHVVLRVRTSVFPFGMLLPLFTVSPEACYCRCCRASYTFNLSTQKVFLKVLFLSYSLCRNFAVPFSLTTSTKVRVRIVFSSFLAEVGVTWS